MKYESKIDVPVLLIFFCRDEQFKQVFEQVKIARPSRLYLYQDGAREGNQTDVVGIAKCREIASEVDWDCEVRTMYQDKNYGCDPSEFIAQKWMFFHEEMGIVLEDDDVPSQSFFPFCRELLEKYKDDTRINMICGMNNLGNADWSENDYLFTTSGSICGWASWRRVIDTWDEHYTWLNDPEKVSIIRNNLVSGQIYKKFIQRARTHSASGKAHYETILAASSLLNSRLNIVTTKNMICNIGSVAESTHGVDIKLLPKGIRRIFNMEVFDINFPIKHPDYVVEDLSFLKKNYRLMGHGHTFVKIYRRIESFLYKIYYKNIKSNKISK